MPKRELRVIKENCTGCGVCEEVCPYNAIEVINGIAVVKDNCVFCGICVESCAFEALELYEEKPEERTVPEGYSGVMTYAEVLNGELSRVSLEILSIARELAKKLNTNVTTLLIGHNIEKHAKALINHGADKVIVVDHSELNRFIDEKYAKIFVTAIEQFKPEVVIGGATAVGRALFPRVAALLKTGLTADCTEFDIEKETGLLLQTRPAFGGNIMATIKTEFTRPQMATVRPRVFKPLTPEERDGEIIKLEYEPHKESFVKQVLDVLITEGETVNLEDADIIVSGGRGVGSKENFKVIFDLAKELNAAVGASRAAVDAGWIPYAHQVGQTGKTVSPKIYIACGISGAIQHQVGMRSSDFIIAINKDPEAPIFDIADLGIVGDLFEVIPVLIKEIKKKKGE